MLASSLLLFSASLACMAAAHPIHSDLEHEWSLVREKRSPMAARTMILIRGQPTNTGYHYARPERAFNPRAAMATYATGGTVATGHYYGAAAEKQNCGHCKQLVDEQPDAPQPDEEQTKASEPPAAPEEVPAEVDYTKAPERKPKAPKAPKAPPKRRPVEDEEEDDEEDEVVPRKGGRRGGSVYTNFFPVTFGSLGSGRVRAAGDEDGEGDGGFGPVTAIANSFSKGRGAIASSSAVAYGHPARSQPRQS